MSDPVDDPNNGIVLDYSQMTPLPIIRYDSITNSIVFNILLFLLMVLQLKMLSIT